MNSVDPTTEIFQNVVLDSWTVRLVYSDHTTTENVKNEFNVFTGSTLCQRNLKTVLWLQKQIKCFPFTLAQINLKKQQLHQPFGDLGLLINSQVFETFSGPH